MAKSDEVLYIHPPKKEISQKHKYLFLIVFSLALILVGIFSAPLSETMAGMKRIILSPSNLTTDYLALGNLGSAFLNSGLLTLFSVLVARFHKTQVTGPMVAGFLTVAGCSFFGKNMYNSIPIMLGVSLYALILKKPVAQYMMVSLFSSALSPVVSYIAFGMDLPLFPGMILGQLAGLVIGALLPPLTTHMLNVHQGFTLYNVGFTSGFVAMIVTSLLRLCDYEVTGRNIVSSEYHTFLLIFLFALFAVMFLWGYILNHKQFRGLKQIYQTSGKLVTDFIAISEMGPTLMNMGMMGAVLSFYVLLIQATFDGVIVGAIISAVGFSAFGNHIRNSVPILIGVFLVSHFTPMYHVTDTSAVVAAIFGTSLAPISGYYGWFYGITAGVLHMALVGNVGYLHGGLNLYNNGFSSGFIAVFMVPLLDNLANNRKERLQNGKTAGKKNRK